MMRTFGFLLLLACLSPYPLKSQALTASDFAGDRAGLQAMLEYILTADPGDRKKITESLKPKLTDCEAVFEGNMGKKVYRYQRKINRQARIIVRPLMQAQTHILLWGADTDQLADYSGEARFFPGGYKELAPFLKPDQQFYRFKFTQPGRKLGSAYDMMVYVNGKWCLIHRPWAVLVE